MKGHERKRKIRFFVQHRSVGLLLQTIPYLGEHRILKILTAAHGLISLMAKHVYAKKYAGLTTPFLYAEWIYSQTNRDLYAFKDATLIYDLPDLKTDYRCLAAAGAIAQDLLRTQLPEKSAETPLSLALAYLNKLPAFDDPQSAALSFRLKLLRYEGTLQLQQSCNRCSKAATHLDHGESVCTQHAPLHSLSLSSEEFQKLLVLAHTRSFSQLQKMQSSESLIKKIDTLSSKG